MKKSALVIAGSAAIMTICATSVSAFAADAVNFEDGDYSFVSMKTDDGGDASKLSVVDFNGSKQLKVDVTDCGDVPKVCFDLNKILDGNDFDKVKTVEMSVILESKDGTTAPGWAGGAVGTQGGEDNTPKWAQTSWEYGEYDKAVSDPFTIQRKFLLASERLVNHTPGTHMIVMRWGADVEYNMYIDNVTFLDDDGNKIDVKVGGEAAAETEAATETATEAVVEEIEEVIVEDVEEVVETEAVEETEAEVVEDAPESDVETTPATTGNTAAIAAATALVLSGYAVAMTRKKK